MRSIGSELLIAALATAISAQDVQLSAAAVCPAAGLWSSTFVRGQSCYEFKGVEQTWVQARTYCHERDGRLVSITDADLQAWLSSSAARIWPKKNGVWIGLSDRSTGGVFVWDDYGTTAEHQMSYSNWAPGRPQNGRSSDDCVHMRRDINWQWQEQTCEAWAFYFYNYICEYRASTLNVTTTAVTVGSLPVITSVAGVATASVATDYPLAGLSSSASSNATHDAVAVTGTNDVTLPLSISMAVVVIVVALVALIVVVRRRRQRFLPPKGSTVLWTRTDGDAGIMVGNPMYSDSAQLAVDQTSLARGIGSDGVSERPVSNIYIDMNSAAIPVGLSTGDTEPTYAEPLIHEPSAAVAAEPATLYHQYAYIDTATLQKVQQPGMSFDEACTDKKLGSVVAVPDQQFYHARQPNGTTPTQDGYEPFVSQWTPYENVQKPDV